MTSIYCHTPRENWFCDRYAQEFKEYSKHDVSLESLKQDDGVIWLLASWCWQQIPEEYLKNFPVVCTIHHEVPWKFDDARRRNFLERDKFVDVYHVTCEQTENFISGLTTRPIVRIGYWLNDKIWTPRSKKNYGKEVRKRLNITKDEFVVGSFQRDTEGHDLITPKLEKGPDRFCEYVEFISKHKPVHVLLNGWRRQYIQNRLTKSDIKWSYIELPEINYVNKMYHACDLYFVGSRYEGGPQSILECAATETPIISTNVGIVSTVLDSACIFDSQDIVKTWFVPAQSHIECAARRAKSLNIANQVKAYDELFGELRQ
jgi:glycosyltransferase involved in cell wall biosynthesis